VEACALTGKTCEVSDTGAACVEAGQTTDTGAGQGTDTDATKKPDAGDESPQVDTEPTVDTGPRLVQMGFCNTVVSGGSTEITLGVELGEGANKVTFSARSGCCDRCVTMTVLPEMPAVLYSSEAILYETTVPITQGSEHLLVAILDPETHTPALGYINIELEDQVSCERYATNAYGFCDEEVDAGESQPADAGP
jgi:hypothetical protein